MGQNTKSILLTIASKQKEAPYDWKDKIAKIMKVKPATVDAYARGLRGIKNDKHIEVLTLLLSIIEEHQTKIQKLTA